MESFSFHFGENKNETPEHWRAEVAARSEQAAKLAGFGQKFSRGAEGRSRIVHGRRSFGGGRVRGVVVVAGITQAGGAKFAEAVQNQIVNFDGVRTQVEVIFLARKTHRDAGAPVGGCGSAGTLSQHKTRSPVERYMARSVAATVAGAAGEVCGAVAPGERSCLPCILE